jgi:DNA-binding response OmpR family regulator
MLPYQDDVAAVAIRCRPAGADDDGVDGGAIRDIRFRFCSIGSIGAGAGRTGQRDRLPALIRIACARDRSRHHLLTVMRWIACVDGRSVAHPVRARRARRAVGLVAVAVCTGEDRTGFDDNGALGSGGDARPVEGRRDRATARSGIPSARPSIRAVPAADRAIRGRCGVYRCGVYRTAPYHLSPGVGSCGGGRVLSAGFGGKTGHGQEDGKEAEAGKWITGSAAWKRGVVSWTGIVISFVKACQCCESEAGENKKPGKRISVRIVYHGGKSLSSVSCKQTKTQNRRHDSVMRIRHNKIGENRSDMRLLLVEDDEAIAQMIAGGLEEDHHTVDVVHDGREGYEQAQMRTYALILLDVMLPGMDGWQVCEALRSAGDNTPVLMLTARDAVSDRVRGLEMGADDYLPKPFHFAELRARVGALLRRDRVHKSRVIRIDDLEIDTRLRRVTRAGREVLLTPREFVLLEALATHEGQVLTREVIQERIWMDEDSFSNTVDVRIGGLRKKIDADHPVKLIQTVHGLGYSLKRPPESKPPEGNR